MKVNKPDQMGLVRRTLHWQGRDVLALGMLAYFDLHRPHAESLLPEAELWRDWPTLPGAGPVLDEGLPKARAEFLVYGSACAPGAQPVTQLVLSAQVGGVRKSLLVQGARERGPLGVSSPKPFSQLPVTPAYAYGGPGFADNPHGLGYEQSALPCIEDPRHLVVHASDRAEAAGFWALDSQHPRRQKALGTFDKQWLRQHWPALPPDTQAAYFQSAPPDQWGAAEWQSGDAIELLHWSAQAPSLRSQLPELRARCLLSRRSPNGGAASAPPAPEEVAAHAETVWLFPGLGRAAVLYRAEIAIADPDALDVAQLDLSWYPTAANAVQAPTALPVAAEPAPAASSTQLPVPVPATPPSAAAAEAAAPEALTPEPSIQAASVAAASPLQAVVDKLLQGHALSEADAQSILQAPSTELPELSDDHLKALSALMLKERDALLAEAGLTPADAAAFARGQGASAQAIAVAGATTAQLQAAAAGSAPLAPLSPATPLASSQLQAMVDKLLVGQAMSEADAKTLLSADPSQLPEFSDAHMHALITQMLDERDAVLGATGLSPADVAAELESRGASRQAIELAAATRAQLESVASGTMGAVPLSAPVSALDSAPLQAIADKLLLGGHISPSELNQLTSAPAQLLPEIGEAHLEALTQQMLDERDAVLAEAGLTESDVAKFLQTHGASAQAVQLGGLTRNDFQRAMNLAKQALPTAASAVAHTAAQAPATQAATAPAQAAAAAAAAAPLASAPAPDEDGAAPAPAPVSSAPHWTRESVQAHHAQGGQFQGEDLSGLDLSELDLSGADFSDATLEKTSFAKSQLAGARFDRAQMPQADLSGAQAAQASFSQARAASAVLAGAQLPGAKLDGADFHAADFSGAQLQGAHCARTDFQQARMAGLQARDSVAPQASFEGAELSGADFENAKVEAARFSGAKLADARLLQLKGARSEWYGTQAAGADFSAAQLEKARGGSGADFSRAKFDGAQLNGTVWDGVKLAGASLRGAQLVNADFSASHAPALVLEAADARGTNWSRANLAHVQASHANLMGASLRRAQLAQARMAGSNLHGADLEAADLKGADLRGALTTATLLAIEGRPEAAGVLV